MGNRYGDELQKAVNSYLNMDISSGLQNHRSPVIHRRAAPTTYRLTPTPRPQNALLTNELPVFDDLTEQAAWGSIS